MDAAAGAFVICDVDTTQIVLEVINYTPLNDYAYAQSRVRAHTRTQTEIEFHAYGRDRTQILFI